MSLYYSSFVHASTGQPARALPAHHTELRAGGPVLPGPCRRLLCYIQQGGEVLQVPARVGAAQERVGVQAGRVPAV